MDNSSNGFILDHGDHAPDSQSDAELIIQKFIDINSVLENPASTAILMNYLHTQSKEINSLLFYSAVKKYERICQKKDEMRNYLHCNMEIYSVFVHPSSILRVPINNSVLQKRIIGNLSSEDCLNQYIMVLEEVKNKTIQSYIDEYLKSIKTEGDQLSFECLTLTMSRSEELALIEKVHSHIRNSLVRNQKSRCLPLSPQTSTKVPHGSMKLQQLRKHLNLDQEIRAKFQALSTQYEYFHGSSCLYTVKPSNGTVPNNSFLNNYTKKLKKLRIKGHLLQECSPPSIKNCLFCEFIIWGSFPMCFYCKICRNYFHHSCKDLATDCIKEEELNETKVSLIKRKQSSGLNSLRQIFKFEEDPVPSSPNLTPTNSIVEPIQSKTSEESKYDSLKSSTEQLNEPQQNIEPDSASCNNPNSSRFDFECSKRSKAERTSSLKEEKQQKYAFLERSLQKKLEAISDVNQAKTKLTMRNSKTEYMNVRTKRRSKSQSRNEDHNRDSTSQNRLSTSDFSHLRRASVFVPVRSNLQNMMPEEIDEELTVLNVFDPEIEFKNFPDFDQSNTKSESYKRHMSIMEFHHKVKYIRKFFKEIQIYLVEPWRDLNENMELFEIISLDSVQQIYCLMNNFAKCIENCTSSSGYNKNIGASILNWFREDCYANLHDWSTIAIDLFCTNTLHAVCNAWKEQQKISSHPLSQLLTQRHNKMVVVEQLGNVRPILMSLPTITNHVISILKKSTLYTDELPAWKELMKILCYVPKTIDKKCMPVAHLINQNRMQNAIGSKQKNNNNITSTTPTPLPSSSSSTKLTYSNSNSSNSIKLKHSNSAGSNSEAMLKHNDLCKEPDDINSRIARYVQNFPKSIFKRNFVDFQYVKVSNVSEIKTNEPKSLIYVKDTIEGVAIYYDNMIVILVKENDKYLLKKWKAAQRHDRIIPIFPLDQVHSTKKTISETEHELSIVMINTAILVQLIFKEEVIRDRWHEQITSGLFKPFQSTAIQYKISGASDYAEIIEEESKTILQNDIEELNADLQTDEDTETLKSGSRNLECTTEEGASASIDKQYQINFEDEFDKVQEDLNAAVLSIAETKHYLNTKLGKFKSGARADYMKRLLTTVVEYTSLTSEIVAHTKEELKSVIKGEKELSDPVNNDIDQSHLDQLEEVNHNVAVLIQNYRKINQSPNNSE